METTTSRSISMIDDPEAGIATAEFSIVTLAAVGFAGLLVTILSGGQVKGMLMGLISKALGL